jgi:transformation/transcription domain-associated protein
MAQAQAKRVQEIERMKRQKAAQEQAANPTADANKPNEEDQTMAEPQSAQEAAPESASVKTEPVEPKPETAAVAQAEETSRGPGTQVAAEAEPPASQDAVPGSASAGQSQTPVEPPASASATDEKGSEQPTSAQPKPPPNFQLPRQPQEYVDDTLNILKTAFPLLALSMEKMVDHINVRSRAPPEEDVYRFLSALLTDALSVSGLDVARNPS